MDHSEKLLVLALFAGCRLAPDLADDVAWSAVAVPPVAGASLRGLCVPSNDVLWDSGSGGVVARSTDGGASWRDASPAEAVRDGLDLRSIHAVDETTAWVASAGEGAASRILRTTDGGRSWTTVHENRDETGFFDSLRFWDARRGILMGDPVVGFLTLLVTEDGGTTWRRLARETLPPPVEGEYGFAASNRTIALGPRGTAWVGTGGAVARVWSTRDGGASWSVASTPVRQGDAASGIFALAFADERRGVCVGGNYGEPDERRGTCAWTVDGGRTWTLAAEPPRGYRSSVAPSPRHATTWLAVGISGTDVSRDGGRTWRAIGGADEELNAVAFVPDGRRAWAVGPRGAVRRMDL